MNDTMEFRQLTQQEHEIYLEYNKRCTNGVYLYLARMILINYFPDAIPLAEPENVLRLLEEAQLVGPVTPVRMREYYCRGIKDFQEWIYAVEQSGEHEEWFND